MSQADLYHEDFYVWTQEQAAALRAAGKAGGRSNAIDWERVAEEVEDLGKSEFREVSSFVARIIEHLFKLEWSARIEPKAGWRGEIELFRLELEREFTPSLRAKVASDLEPLHKIGAKRAALSFLEHEPDAPRDESLRWSLEEILGERDDPLDRLP